MPSLRVSAALAAFLALPLLASPQAEARRMSPAASAAAYQQCLLSDDAQANSNNLMWGCCSHEAGICVVCFKPAAADGNDSCDVVAYRATQLNGTRTQTRSKTK